jgi:hypothetical protein
LSNWAVNPEGIRGGASFSGMLQDGQGIPAPPQSQPCGPSQGRLGWFSQTHPVSAQKMHFIGFMPGEAVTGIQGCRGRFVP